ncbi:hypothetical protein E4T47_05606 [Aureobasidium subglaciale]|nr:hypothetical protein E4T47_05606 [Aureobasidium subglaciale]
MPHHLECKINEVYQNSALALKCVEKGPFELAAISHDLGHLSETLKLLADSTNPSVALFDMATREQASELWSALEACDRNISNIRSIWTSYAELDWKAQSEFVAEASLSTGGTHYLQSKIIAFSSALKGLLVDFKILSAALNWPPSIDVLGQIQVELLAEGILVDHLKARHDEIKAYIRSLAIGEQFDTTVPHIASRLSLSAISESPMCAQLPSRQVTDMADQFSTLFEPRALRRPSLAKIIVSGAPMPLPPTSLPTSEKKPPSRPQPPRMSPSLCFSAPARADTKSSIAPSLVSQLSEAITSIAFCLDVQNKSRVTRPLPQRSSSAVFRGLANEERATGD